MIIIITIIINNNDIQMFVIKKFVMKYKKSSKNIKMQNV